MTHTLSQATIQALTTSYLPTRFVNKIIKDCQVILDQSIDNLLYIVLFGSCAKGTIHMNSDVDLLIITQTPIDPLVKSDLCYELDDAVEGISTDIVFYDLETYLNSTCLLVSEIKQYGKILWRHA